MSHPAAPAPATWLSRLREWLHEQFRHGLTPHKIALAVAVSAAFAVIPLVGATTLLCTAAAILLRLNQPIVQTINFGSYPLQLALLVPFWRAGERIFRVPVSSRFALSRLAELVSRHPMNCARALWSTVWHGIVAWGIVSPVGGIAVYFLTLGACCFVARRRPAGKAGV